MQKFHPYSGPKSFSFTDPDTGHIYKAANKEQLIERITNYRRQNQLSKITYLEQVVDNYLCSLPENAGSCQHVVLQRGLLTTLKGGIALLENVFAGEKNIVSQETAELRSQICLTCPLNVFPDKGPFMEWSDNVAIAVTGGRKTSYNDRLGNCAGCSCVLRAKVFTKPPFRLSETEKVTMAEANPNCWQVNNT